MDEGYVIEDQDKFTVLKNLPSIAELTDEIQLRLLDMDKKVEEVFAQFWLRCVQNFSSVLQGKISPLAYMFPEDPNEVGAIRFFSECKLM